MRPITCQYNKRCAWCHDWVVAGKPAYYKDATKEIWHPDCIPPDPEWLKKQHELADRLGFDKPEDHAA